MRIVFKRIVLSLLGGTLFQLSVYFLFTILGLQGLSVVFLWAAVLFIGDQYPQPWGPYLIKSVLVIAINNLVYSTLIYFLLWNRTADKEEPAEVVDF